MERKIDQYFKKKLSIEEGAEIPEEYSKKINVIVSGIVIGDIASESVKEQLDAIFDEYRISVVSDQFEQIESKIAKLNTFGIKVEDGGEDKLLDKIELSSAILKWHGFVGLDELSQENLTKITKLYKSILNKEIAELKYEDFNKVRNIDIDAIKEVKKLNSEDIDYLIKSLESFGVLENIDSNHASKVKCMNGIYREFGIADNWYKDEAQKKLKILLNANKITKLAEIDEDKSKALSLINKELKINISEISVLKLKAATRLLSALEINANSKLDELENAIKFINNIGGFKNLNSHEAEKVGKIIKLLGIENRGNQEILELIGLMRSVGIEISLEKNIDQEITKIEKLCLAIKEISGEEASGLHYLQLKEWINIVEGLTGKKALETEGADLTRAKEALKLFPLVKDYSDGSNVYNLPSKLSEFDVDIKEKEKVTNLSKNLKSLGINIWKTTRDKAIEINKFLEGLELKITEPTEDEANAKEKLQKAIKINQYLGGNYDVEGLENIKELVKIFGKNDLAKIEIEEIDLLKTITDHLGINPGKEKRDNIKDITKLLSDYKIVKAYEEKGMISKLWNGKNKAITDKIEEIAEIFKSFEYGSLLDIIGEEKIKFDELVRINKKKSINDLTKEVAENIKGFLDKIGVNIKGESAYRIQIILNGIYKAGADLFGDKKELEIYGDFIKELNLKPEEITETKGHEIKEALNQLGYSNNLGELVEIKEGIERLHLPNILEISNEQKDKIKELGEAITGSKQEISPIILSNIGIAGSWYKIAFKEPVSSVKYHSPYEEGIIEKMKFLQLFSINLSCKEDTAIKNKAIILMAHNYKELCHKDTSEQIDYDKEFNSIIESDKEKVAGYIEVSEKNYDCLKYLDQKEVIEECKEYFNELRAKISDLCPGVETENTQEL